MSGGRGRMGGSMADVPAMTERELSKAVVQLAETLGWKVFTISNSKAAAQRSHTGVGFPDLLMVRNGRLAAVELKTEKGKLRPEQKEWLMQIAGVQGCDAYEWRPRHWSDGTIERVLKFKVEAS